MRAYTARIFQLFQLSSDCHLAAAVSFRRVKALMSMLKSGLRSRDIITRKAIENSIVVVYSLGGSTNAFLHILAIAHEAEVPLTIQEIGEIGKPVPLLGNMRPHGRWHMSDLSKIGANSQIEHVSAGGWKWSTLRLGGIGVVWQEVSQS